MIRTIALLSVLSFPSLAQAKILPENDLYLQDCLSCFNSSVTKDVFNKIIDDAEKVYGPVITGFGANLIMNKEWSDSTVNASAQQDGDDWHVNMYGGLARRAEVTPDGFTLVVCHELGHHLAGFPFSSSWAANEGESDFFATHKCAPTLWEKDLEENAKARAVIPETPKKACDDVYNTEQAQDLCYRIALAGESLATLLGALRDQKPSFDTPDTSKVRRTNNNHPDAQCRLDTYMAGAVCLADYDREVIPGKKNGNSLKAEQHSASFHCTKSQQYLIGLRPTCWFKARL